MTTGEIRSIETVATELPKQMARVRECLKNYHDLPNNAGLIGATLIEQDLQRADKAAVSGDVVEMIRVLAILKGIN